MSTVEQLEKARELIEVGWCQRLPFTTAYIVRYGQRFKCTRHCLTGALWRSFSNPEDLDKMYRLLDAAIPIPSGKSLPWWNDEPGRTKEEVLGALDRAIKLAKELEDDTKAH